MKENRFRFGVLASILWIGIIAFIALHDPKAAMDMKPNEWGDFFAGLFAPVAFLWLVLGYLQQGEELQLSTRALHLQAEELKNSVEQQRELVEVTRQQVESEREALSLELVARREAAKPHFVIKQAGGSFSSNSARYRISISNAGNTVTDILAYLENPDIDTITLLDIPMFAKLEQKEVTFNIAPPFSEIGYMLSITYFDTYGQPGKVTFGVTKKGDSINSNLEFEQTTV
jgi:hypothetical protein